MDHLLPPLGVGSGRERETLQAWGTGCSLSLFFSVCKGQIVIFLFVSSAGNCLFHLFIFVQCEKIQTNNTQIIQ